MLQIAMHILCAPIYVTSMIDYAEELYVYFVKDFSILYGEEYVSYNIHNLIHLSEYCKKYGPLDSFSTFQFESNFQKVKRKLKKCSFLLYSYVIDFQNRKVYQ